MARFKFHYNKPENDIKLDINGMFDYDTAIINEEQGYYIKLSEDIMCSKCKKQVHQYVADSMGVGYLRCGCSEWEAPCSPFSGHVYAHSKLRRVQSLTIKQLVGIALYQAQMDPKLIKEITDKLG